MYNKITCFCLVSVFSLATSVQSYAATYYLDKAAGSDSNPGTSWTAAWATLSKCQSTLASGDTVLIKNGLYGNFSKTASAYTNWVTYKAAEGNNAVIFGNLYLSHSSGVNYYHRFEGIVFNKADYSGSPPDYYLSINKANYVYFKNCIIRGTGYTRNDDTTAIYINSNNLTLDGCIIEGQDTSLDCSFQYGFRGSASATNITITGCDIRGCWRNMVNGYNWAVTNNTIHDGYQDGIFVEGNNNGTGQQLLIENNHIYNFFVNPAGDHTDLLQFGQTGSSIKNVIIRGNICHDTDHQIWWLNPPVGSGPCLIENNLIYNDWMSGQAGNSVLIGNMSTPSSGSLIIRNNIFDVDMMLANYRNHYDQITGNIIRNFNYDWDGEYYGTTGPVTCDLENYNIIYRWGTYADSHVRGSGTITINSQSEFEALFKNYGQHDYTPAAGAVSIGRVPLNLAPSIDLNGNTRTNPTEAGCYKSGSSSTTNHAPVLSAIGNKSVSESSLLTFTISATDADGDTLTYTAQNLPTGATFSNRTFTWTPDLTQAGTYQVTFTVSDGQASDSEVITITVINTSTNNSPVLAAIGNKSVSENSLLSFTISATDADGDTLTYTAQNLPTGATFSNRTFTWTPGYTQAGTYQVTFTVSDGQASDSETITVTVSNTNRPPVLASIGNKSVSENSLLSFTISATDADGDTLTYTAQNLPTGATFSNRVFTWTPGSAQAGTYQVTFTVSDVQTSDSETITITVGNINNTPVLAAIGNKSVGENSLLTFTISATDADGDTLTYSAQSLPTGATFSNRTFTWTPGYTQAGTYQVMFTVSDSQTSNSETISITVTNTNRSPVLAAIGNKSVSENSLLSFTISATDADSDTLTYTAQNLPTGATFSNRTFTWTPGSAQAGTYQVTFTVSDSQASDSETVTVTVSNTNNAPVLAAIGSKSVSENSLLSFTISATDTDGDTLTYTAQNLPTGATFSNRTFTWTPGYTQAGAYQVTLAASDGQASDSETITVTVSNTNRSPVLAAIGNKSVGENSLLSFTISATDADGDALTYTAQNLPTGATFSNRTFTWTPGLAQAGTYQVTFNVSDSQASDAETITITVNNTNIIPTANAGADQTVTDTDDNGSQQVTLNGSGSSDSDGSITSYIWRENSTQIATGASPSATLDVGIHTITLTVTDNGGLTATDTVIITVESPASSDTVPPSIISVTASNSSVEVQFSEALDEASATNAANYSISGGLTVDSIWPEFEFNRVTLYIATAHQNGTIYTLTVANVKDAAGNTMLLTNRSYEFTEGLVGYWTFDNSDGSSVDDDSGYNNTGALFDDAALTARGEVNIMGSSNAFQIPMTDMNANEGTVTLWAYPTKNQAGKQFLFGHTIGTWSNRIQVYVENGSLGISLGNSSTTQTDIQTLSLQTWYHIALSWNDQNYIVYVDGIVKAAGSYSGLTQLNTIADFGNTGNYAYHGGGFNGLIEEARIYSRCLTSAEINDMALVFLPIGDKTVTEGDNLSFAIRTKPGVTVTLSDMNLPSAPSFASNVFSWTPGGNSAGTYEVEFTVAHGASTDFEKIIITVVQTPPVVPIGYWKLDEMSGDIAVDSSATGNTGYLRNGLTWDSGYLDGAIAFSVPNDAVEISTANFNPRQGTIAMWVYVGRQTLSKHYFFGHGADTVNRIQLYTKYSYLCLGLGDTHETRIDIQRLQRRRWYHITLTWNGSTYNVYVDGVLKASGTYSGLTALADHADIGNNGNSRDKGLNGKIDNVQIFNRALKSAEITRLLAGN